MSRPWAAGTAAGVIVALGLVTVPSPAAAHATLLTSTPAQGEVVKALPDQVTLEFTEDMAEPAYVIVRSPQGVVVTRGDPEVRGAVVTQRLAADGQDGAYSMAYRAVSKDGHPLSGEISFSVGKAGQPSASPPEAEGSGGGAAAASTVEPGTTSAPDGRDVASTAVDVGVGAALFLLALLLLGLSRRAEGG